MKQLFQRGWRVALAVAIAITTVSLVHVITTQIPLFNNATLFLPFAAIILIALLLNDIFASIAASIATALIYDTESGFALAPLAVIEMLVFLAISVAIISILHKKEHLRRRLQYLSDHDPLTMLPNRRLFESKAAQVLEIARRHDRKFAILFVDVDDFKEVNDNLGHEYGDFLLQEIARRLRLLVRKEDTVARQGGDEFIILLAELEDVADAKHVAEKIVACSTEPFVLIDKELRITFSVGIAVYPEHGTTLHDLERHADDALYRVKTEGGGKAALYVPAS